MKLISWNVGGIMSRVNDGTLNKIFDLNPDIFSIQEVHTNPSKLDDEVVHKINYDSFFYHGIKYDGHGSGVATYTKFKPITFKNGFDNRKFDDEGRIQRLEFDEFTLFNVYFPTGSGEEKFEDKLEFYDLFTRYVKKSRKPQIICGDFNRIASFKDVYEPENHKYTIGCKKIELQWFQEFLDSGFIDSFRLFNKETGNYTWWPNQGKFREENKGFRFDYFLVNEELKDNVVNASILNHFVTYDHAPITLELEF